MKKFPEKIFMEKFLLIRMLFIQCLNVAYLIEKLSCLCKIFIKQALNFFNIAVVK